MPITLSCGCGKRLAVKDELAGKKIKCPGCQAVVRVPAAPGADAGGAPPLRPVRAAAAEDDDALPAATVARKPARVSAGQGPARGERETRRGKPGSKKMLFVVLGGVALLVVCSVGAFFLFRGFSAPADQLLTVPAEVKDKWSASDSTMTHPQHPRSGSFPYKAYRVNLKANTTYLIDLMRTSPQVHLADFVIEDKAGKKVASSVEESGKRIGLPPFAPPSDGEYRLLVLPATPGLGDFKLTLKEGGSTPRAAEKLAVIQPRVRFKVDLRKAGFDADKISSLFLSADGSRLAVSIDRRPNKLVQVWEVAGQPQKRWESDGVCAALAPDGKRLVRYARFDAEMVDVDSGMALGKLTAGEFSSGVLLTWFPTTIVGVSKEPLRIQELDASTRKLRGTFKGPNEGPLYLSPPVKSGKELIVGVEKTGRLQVWDVPAHKLIREIPLAGATPKKLWYGYTVSPDGKWVAAQVEGEPAAKIFKAADGAAAASLPRGVGPYNAVFCPGRDLYLAPGNLTPSGKGPPDILAYDINKQSFVAAFRGLEKPLAAAVFTADGRVSAEGVAVSADGNTLAAGDEAGNVLLWDLAPLK